MYFVKYDFICERLKIKQREAVRLFPHGNAMRVDMDRIILELNTSRQGLEKLDHIPADLLTPDEAAKETGISKRLLMRWARRDRNICPHFRLSRKATRFKRDALIKWLTNND